MSTPICSCSAESVLLGVIGTPGLILSGGSVVAMSELTGEPLSIVSSILGGMSCCGDMLLFQVAFTSFVLRGRRRHSAYITPQMTIPTIATAISTTIVTISGTIALPSSSESFRASTTSSSGVVAASTSAPVMNEKFLLLTAILIASFAACAFDSLSKLSLISTMIDPSMTLIEMLDALGNFFRRSAMKTA